MCSSRSIAVDRYQGGEPWGERYAGAAGRETMPEAAWKRWDTSSEVAVSNLQIIVCVGRFGFFAVVWKGGGPLRISRRYAPRAARISGLHHPAPPTRRPRPGRAD